MFEGYLRESAYMVIVLGGIPLAVSSLVGLIIAVLQAATQIQEQTFSYFARLVALCIVLAMMMPWMGEQLISYMKNIFHGLSAFGLIN